MTTSVSMNNARAYASARILPVLDAAIILVVSVCVVVLRIIAPTA